MRICVYIKSREDAGTNTYLEVNRSREMSATEDIDDLLIDLVRLRPYLYNIKDRRYKDNKLKENAWEAVGEMLSISGKKNLYTMSTLLV